MFVVCVVLFLSVVVIPLGLLCSWYVCFFCVGSSLMVSIVWWFLVDCGFLIVCIWV